MSWAWMPWNIGDYRRDTGHLSTLEHGAYLLLIMHYWETGPIPDDDTELAQIALLPVKRWGKVRPKIARFFKVGPLTGTRWEANAKHLVGNWWSHKRIDLELEKAENISLKRKIAGQRGGIISRGANNVGRFATQAIAKQTGGQAQRSKKEASGKAEALSTSSLAESVRARGWT